MLHSVCNLEEKFIWVFSLKREFGINVLLSGRIASVVTIRRIGTHVCTNTEIKEVSRWPEFIFIYSQAGSHIYYNCKGKVVDSFYLIPKYHIFKR